jgi:BlaI family transcriptional regulator, penicillinase repressor
MSKARSQKPTDGELAILRVLWVDGPCSVRHVHEVLSEGRTFAYTTTLKLMQIMTEKGLATREVLGLQHLYRAVQSQEDTQRQLVTDLLHRAFGGSMSNLVMQALATKKTSPKELRAIRRLLAGSKENKP